MLTYLFKERKYLRTKSGNFHRRATLTPPVKRLDKKEVETPNLPTPSVSEALNEFDHSEEEKDK